MDDDSFAGFLWGLIAAILVGVWLVKRDGEGDIGDQIGDVLVDLTTSEETKLAQLEPETQVEVRALINDLAAGVPQDDGTIAVIRVHVGSTLRTPAQEKAAVASGHSSVKTHSWHELGRAADLYPINPDTGQPDMAGAREDLFLIMQKAAVARGFRQIAYHDDWSPRTLINSAGKPYRDLGHVEWHGPYATIAEAVAAEGANYGIT